MADQYGDLQVPAQQPPDDGPGAGQPVDRVLDCIGAYLKAVLIADIGEMWDAAAPGLAGVVRRVFTADPEDVLLNESHLPALFVWDPEQANHQQLADDWWTTDRSIVVLWMLEPGAIDKREIRMRIQSSLTETIHHSLAMGRHPAWVDPNDTDPTAATRGSVLIKRAGLITLPKPQRSQRVLITISRENADPVTYRAFRTVVIVTQRFKRDPAVHGVASATEISVQQGGNTVVTRRPITP